jgi:hypothetical protein
VWTTQICRSRLAGDAVVGVMTPSLASQLLQGIEVFQDFVGASNL